MLDPAARVAAISEQAHALAKEAKLELIEDEALLSENAGLTEWPVVLMGSFDKAFLEVPGEVLMTSMKTHQKCFSLRVPRAKKLANKFLLVSNLVAEDGGAEIIAGNEKVIAARLSDAKFFWDQDLKHPLGEMAGKLVRHHVPREARHAEGSRRAHRGAGVRAGGGVSTPIRRMRAAPRRWRRPISFQEWSASFPSCKA